MSIIHSFSNIMRYGSIAAALIGVFAIVSVSQTQAEKQMPPPGDPPIIPPQKPYAQSVAAIGILEALSENVAIGVPMPGLVSEVCVEVNHAVKKDQALMKLDDRELRAERLQTEGQLEIARAQIAVSEAQLGKLEKQLARITSVADARAVSQDDLVNRQQDVEVAKAQMLAAKADFRSTEAALERLSLLTERLTIRAPRDGTIIQINVRAGEYASTAPKAPAIILGDTAMLQVRADIDEQNATRIRQGQAAYGYLKGNPKITFPLTFVRIEPYVIPKVSLTGASTERVDTRVLQVIYSLNRPADLPLYVGQQVDVYIEAPDAVRSP